MRDAWLARVQRGSNGEATQIWVSVGALGCVRSSVAFGVVLRKVDESFTIWSPSAVVLVKVSSGSGGGEVGSACSMFLVVVRCK